MVTVEFLGPINQAPIQVNATSLVEVSEALKEIETLKPWLDNSAVAINDTLIKDTDAPLQDGDRISVLPPVCGG